MNPATEVFPSSRQRSPRDRWALCHSPSCSNSSICVRNFLDEDTKDSLKWTFRHRLGCLPRLKIRLQLNPELAQLPLHLLAKRVAEAESALLEFFEDDLVVRHPLLLP